MANTKNRWFVLIIAIIFAIVSLFQFNLGNGDGAINGITIATIFLCAFFVISSIEGYDVL